MRVEGAGRGPHEVPARQNALDTPTLAPGGAPALERERAARRAHTRRLRADERNRASVVLDAIAGSPRRPARVPSTFSLTPAALAREVERLTTTGGVGDRPPAPWSPAEVARVLALPRRAS